ncbi:hypothetical protein H9P43_009750 [Blastocladiella emersonii ATCC 22665]|nr:hypothetical protein H9P43_009750 [Blastocladiella emersonii ATCC 22665]
MDQLSVLSVQCGNLRDVAHTIDEAKRKYGTADLDFVLCDTHPEVLARDLLVLHAVANGEFAADRTPSRFIGQLYFSQLFEPKARTFWDRQMRLCLGVDWSSPTARVRVLNDETLRAVRHCWKSWLAMNVSFEQMFTMRKQFLHRIQDPADPHDHVGIAVQRFQARYNNKKLSRRRP